MQQWRVTPRWIICFTLISERLWSQRCVVSRSLPAWLEYRLIASLGLAQGPCLIIIMTQYLANIDTDSQWCENSIFNGICSWLWGLGGLAINPYHWVWICSANTFSRNMKLCYCASLSTSYTNNVMWYQCSRHSHINIILTHCLFFSSSRAQESDDKLHILLYTLHAQS